MADLLTIVIASITLYGIFKYKKKFPSIVRALIAHHLTERFSKVRETLSLIDQEKFTKSSTRLRTLFSKLNGQLLPLLVIAPELKDVQLAVEEIAERNGVLNEGIKAKLVHQVEGVLENSRINGLIDIAGEVTNGR
ncbi:hypothetical protein [Thermomonas sp. HDW16]|uniref:hypothetical protein n=1 Tax=Thermomonas sp. HDW16 TaxID=2714945 RepID=UPI00140999A2|nr:hypothetical protein [Thermomonas sp. HDW16]QIL21616.1 hypothetical protein G7079_13205 [Thermomonas sp. HDW16]